LIKQLPFANIDLRPSDREQLINTVRSEFIAEIPKKFKPEFHLKLTTMANVMADLCNQRWELKVNDNHILGKRPENMGTREELRERLVSRRNQQLREKSVNQFINEMEKWRLFKGNRVSILSLMTDGRDLVKRLQLDIEQPVQPYIQFITTDQTCEHTGLKLQDIWRYFRHTWANPYESIPGRSILMIVRDAGAQFHPVMGISALSSAAVRLGARDKFIGWDTNLLIDIHRSNPTNQIAEWVLDTLKKALEGIYLIDFIRDGLITPNPINKITDGTIKLLRDLAIQQKESHHRLMEGGEYKQAKTPNCNSDEDWAELAQNPLFKSKRASELANILEIWLSVNDAFGNLTGKDRIVSLLSTESGRTTFSKIIRIARSMTVGTEIADLTVCGAVAPYNHIAGGKLVAMLATSPEAILGYRNRYDSSSSIIASSMAGKRICRSANLVFIGTTSLYGKRPNQYDRISYPADLVGGPQGQQVKFHFIPDTQADDGISKTTKGIGTFHFGPNTLKAMEDFNISMSGGWRVNNVFGEGASPKLRALRNGLDALNLNADELLTHGIGKCLYGVNLSTNVANYLLGIEPEPNYIFKFDAPNEATRNIANWWHERWVKNRIARKDVIEKILTETLVYPIRHRAKVVMPTDDKEQFELF
jgi:hypothetical protein